MNTATTGRRPKVFQIGFNKTATTSLYNLFEQSGYMVIHGGGRRHRRKGHPALQKINIHRVVHGNIQAGRPPVQGFEDFDGFFDMERTTSNEMLHNYFHFDKFAEAYPDAKFILNYRDFEPWATSRLKYKDGAYARAMCLFYDTDETGLREIWRKQYNDHISRVKAYFVDQPERLFVFPLEQAPVDALSEFVAPHYRLDLAHWGHARSSADRERKQALKKAKLA